MAEHLDFAEIILPDTSKFVSSWLEVRRGEVSRDVLVAAHGEIFFQDGWKREYAMRGADNPNAPAAIRSAAKYMIHSEVVVAKRYSTGVNDSGPVYYEQGLRPFPAKYFDAQNVGSVDLLTTGGWAVLLAKESDEQAEPLIITLTPGTRVTFLKNALKGVSRPLSSQGLKHFCKTRELDYELDVPFPSRTVLFGGKIIR